MSDSAAPIQTGASDESTRADHCQARQDGDADWAEPRPAPAGRRRLDSMLSVRLAPREADAVRAAAERLGLSVSAFLRQAALREAGPAPGSEWLLFAYTCVADLTRWLDIGERELLHRLGISRAAFHSWSGPGSAPQPGATRLLSVVHSLARLVVGAFGEEGAYSWFHSGAPTNRELFLEAAGDREAAKRLAEVVRRIVVPTRMPVIERSLAARADGGDAVMPDAVPEGR